MARAKRKQLVVSFLSLHSPLRQPLIHLAFREKKEEYH